MNDLFIQGLTIDWNRVRPYNYVRQIPAISGIDTFTFHKPITFFVGENGSGKSTLLEAIAVAYGFNAEGGTKNFYRCAQEGAQFIIVSHSPILLGMPDAEIFSFDNGTIHPCQYEDTDSYVITKTFVNNRQHFLNQLLNEET